MAKRARCNSLSTINGKPCKNYADSCPYIEHRRQRITDVPDIPLDASNYAPRTFGTSKPTTSGPARALPMDIQRELMSCAVSNSALQPAQIVKDYWLHAALHRLAVRNIGGDTTTIIGRGRWRRPKPTTFDVVFGGGTALVSQWNLAERFSEDIDLLVIGKTDMTGSDRLRQASIWVANVCADAIAEPEDGGRQASAHSPHPLHVESFAEREGRVDYAKVDVTDSDAEMNPWTHRPVMSLMGRYATDDMRREFPELGGFSLPSLHFAITIGNKMRANIDNVDRGRIDKLRERARDLFDIASVAADSDARGAIIDHSRMCAMNAETRSDAVGQRALAVTRFPDSAALRSGTPENEALEDGYRYVIDSLAWRPNEAPGFETAVEIARSLRPDG